MASVRSASASSNAPTSCAGDARAAQGARAVGVVGRHQAQRAPVQRQRAAAHPAARRGPRPPAAARSRAPATCVRQRLFARRGRQAMRLRVVEGEPVGPVGGPRVQRRLQPRRHRQCLRARSAPGDLPVRHLAHQDVAERRTRPGPRRRSRSHGAPAGGRRGPPGRAWPRPPCGRSSRRARPATRPCPPRRRPRRRPSAPPASRRAGTPTARGSWAAPRSLRSSVVRGSAFVQHPHELLGVEGVAARAFDHGACEPGIERPLERQGSAPGSRWSRRRAARARSSPSGIAGPIRDADRTARDGRPPRSAGRTPASAFQQRLDERQRGFARRVHVLEHHDRGVLGGEPVQEPAPRPRRPRRARCRPRRPPRRPGATRCGARRRIVLVGVLDHAPEHGMHTFLGGLGRRRSPGCPPRSSRRPPGRRTSTVSPYGAGRPTRQRISRAARR